MRLMQYMMFRLCLFLLILWFETADASHATSHFISLRHAPHEKVIDPDFWIGRSNDPDRIRLSPDEIDRRNQDIRTTLQTGVMLLDETVLRSGEALKRNLRQEYDNLIDRLSSETGERGKAFRVSLLQHLALERIPAEIPVRYAIVTRFCDQRLLPTMMPVFADPESRDIDLVQNSALDIGTPLRILHESRDGRWVFVHCDISAGWVKREAVAACDREVINRFLKPETPVVFLNANSSIRMDRSEAPHSIGSVRMGVWLPFAGDCIEDGVSVWIPQRKADGNAEIRKAWAQSRDVRIGFLPMTPRNTIVQAFRLLGAPYGWGGKGHAQDCSRLIQEIFATMGLMLPRNSADQAKAIEALTVFQQQVGCPERMHHIRTFVEPGAGLLYMKGHIMLYLGMIGETVYGLHATHGYRVPTEDPNKERFVRLNRVVVSDLTLGEGTRKGSLCERLISVHGFKRSAGIVEKESRE